MKKVLIVLVSVMFTISLQSQHVFEKGDLLFNAGIGMPYNYGFIPTINFSGEYGVIPTGDVGLVSFGGLAEIQFANYDYYWDGDYSSTKPYFIFGPRASWHLHVFESDKWDVYGGVGFGIAFKGSYNNGNYNSKVSPYGEGFVGGRMMFSDGFGLFAETGWGSRSFIKFGVAFGF